jgi:DNA/RNA-binding domain of Phe-tRNA-synthetase-like protein
VSTAAAGDPPPAAGDPRPAAGDPNPAAGGPSHGWCAPEVREAFPALRLVVTETAPAEPGWFAGPSPEGVRERLRALSDRWSGAQAVMVRRQAVPAAYRVFFRHIGLDPDVQRTPLEGAVLTRLLDGGFLSRDLLADVLLLALVDTSVPVWALDADALDGPLGVRVSSEGEPLGHGEEGAPLAAGQLIVADASAAVAVLFGEPARAQRVGAGTRRLALYALQVEGVPAMCVEEALWSCQTRLEGAGR